MKVGWLWELCRYVRGTCIQCAQLSLASVETGGWEWCDWIWELWQQHLQESSGSVGPGNLTLGQVVIKRVAVVELGENNGTGSGGSCFGIEVWTDKAKLTGMVIARFGDRWDLVGKSEVFIKYQAEVSSRVGGGEWGVVDFGKLFTETNEQKFSLGGVKS